MKQNKTDRGFAIKEFRDFYGAECSIQKSSLATDDAIWLGVDDPNPKIMASDAIELGIETDGQDTGWIHYDDIPKQVHLSTRMHLSREHVAQLIPVLQKFVDTGEI